MRGSDAKIKRQNVDWIWQLQPPDLQVTQNPVSFWSFTLRNYCRVDHPIPPITSHYLSCWWSSTFGFVLLPPWQACEWCVCRDVLTQVSKLAYTHACVRCSWSGCKQQRHLAWPRDVSTVWRVSQWTVNSMNHVNHTNISGSGCLGFYYGAR